MKWFSVYSNMIKLGKPIELKCWSSGKILISHQQKNALFTLKCLASSWNVLHCQFFLLKCSKELHQSTEVLWEFGLHWIWRIFRSEGLVRFYKSNQIWDQSVTFKSRCPIYNLDMTLHWKLLWVYTIEREMQ